MELRHLRYFVALAEQLSFTRAAETVHVTQSTLSHQIKQLETELGHGLFERVGKRLAITERGELFLGRVNNALREIDDAVRSVKGTAEQLAGTLTIGTTHTFNVGVVPGCVIEFLHRNPLVRVTIRDLTSNQVEHVVEAGDVDIGIAYRPDNSRQILFEPLFNDELSLVVSARHAFASRKRIRMIELHGENLVLSTRMTTTRRMLDDWFRLVGAEPVIVAEVDAIAPMLELVRRIDAAAIVSRLVVPEGGDLKVVPLQNPMPVRVPGILWRRDREPSDVARSFAAILRNAMLHAASRNKAPAES